MNKFVCLFVFTWPINSLVYEVRAVNLLLWWHSDRPGMWAVEIAIQWCMLGKMHAHRRLPVEVPLIHRHKLDTRALHRHRLEIVSIHNPFSFNLIQFGFTHWLSHTHAHALAGTSTHANVKLCCLVNFFQWQKLTNFSFASFNLILVEIVCDCEERESGWRSLSRMCSFHFDLEKKIR